MNGRVEGDPAAGLLGDLVVLTQPRDLALPAEERLAIAALLGVPDNGLQEIPDARILLV